MKKNIKNKMPELTKEELCNEVNGKWKEGVCKVKNEKVWLGIINKEREIDKLRTFLELKTDSDALSSKAIERCVDIGREIAKGRLREEFGADFNYIEEKKEKLSVDLEELEKEII